MAWALFTYGGAQSLGASGFLAVYVAGLTVGNRRHGGGAADRSLP